MKSAQRIELKPSRVLAVICAVAHAAAMVLITILSLDMWFKIAGLAAVGASCIAAVRIALLAAPHSTAAIEVTSEDLLNVRTRSAQWLECEVLDSTYVASFLTVLNLRERAAGKRRHVVLLPDGIDAQDFRKLRVWLRWHRDTPGRQRA